MLTPSTPQRAGRNTLGFPRLSFYLLPHQQGTVWALGGAGGKILLPLLHVLSWCSLLATALAVV